MDKDIVILPDDTKFDDFLRLPEHQGRTRHVVVTRDNGIVGVLRVNTALRGGLEGTFTTVTLKDVASRNFTIARSQDIMFTVIGRMWRKKAMMAIVVETDSPVPRPKDVRGVITKEHVADSVADSIKPYANSGGMH